MTILRACLNWLKRNWGWLRWPVALGLLGALLYQSRDEFSRLRDREIHWPFAAAACALSLTAILLTIVRWFLLVWAQDFPFRFRDALRLGFIGYSFTYFAPGAVGGDILKAVLIAREQKSRRPMAAATVVLDRALGMVALFMVGALASLMQPPQMLEHPLLGTVVLILWVGAIVGVVAIAVLLHPAVPRSKWLNRLVRLPAVGRAMGGVINAIVLYQRRRRVVAAAVGISILGHFAMLSSFYFCMRTLDLQQSSPGYWGHIMLIPGAEMAGAVVPTPGGVGALEGAVQASYAVANAAVGSQVDESAALASGLFTCMVFRVINVLIIAIGAFYYFAARRTIDAAIEDAEVTATEDDGGQRTNE
jgi:uncharacterized protein (TIRG00374 family)